jgi:hypothetical protein
MGFPADVRGIYLALAREVGKNTGHVQKRSATAFVFHNRIVFYAREPPPGKERTEVSVHSTNNEPTGYDSSNPDEWKTGNNPSVTLDHWMNTPKATPLMFTSLKRREKRKPAGGGTPEQTPQFTFTPPGQKTTPIVSTGAQYHAPTSREGTAMKLGPGPKGA